MVAAVSHNVLTLSWACGLLKESQGPLHLKQALPAFTAALPDEQQAGGASGQGGEALGLRWQKQRAGQASPAIPVPQASPGSSNSTQSVADMEVSLLAWGQGCSGRLVGRGMTRHQGRGGSIPVPVSPCCPSPLAISPPTLLVLGFNPRRPTRGAW